MKRRIALLGATGSIGRQTLDILRIYPEEFELSTIAVRGSSPELLLEILREFQPEKVFLENIAALFYFREEFPAVQFFHTAAELSELCADPAIEIVLNALPGEAGLKPSMAAVAAGKVLLLANKESLVMAGEELLKKAVLTGARIFPVDSELSAIFQILQAHPKDTARVYLPCSGGPFLPADWSRTRLAKVRSEEALRHPLWKMGPKISIDSATLFNKAFELIALHLLCRIPPERIEVLVHSAGIIHGAVEFMDGEIWVQRGAPDMRPCIKGALFFDHPEHQVAIERCDNFRNVFHFEPVDEKRFKALQIGRKALRMGPDTRALLCLENDRLVKKFLAGKIGFLEIEKGLQAVVLETSSLRREELETISSL